MKKQFITVLCLLICAPYLQAQDVPYTLSVLQQSYERLDDPIFLTNGVWDDPSFVTPIGFDFVYDSTAYSRVGMNSDNTGGFLYFDPDTPPTSIDLLLAYASDVIDPGYNDGKSLGYIASQITGEPGSQIFKIEWNNVGFYAEVAEDSTAANLVSFQLWLYEGSNDIEWHFGPNSIKDASVHDLGAPLIGLVYNYFINEEYPELLISIAGDPAKPYFESITDFATYPTGLSGDPANGTVYRLSSLYVSTRDLPQLESQIKLYPTIVSNQLTMDIVIAPNEDLDLAILDVLGRDWAPTKTLTSQQNLDLSHLPAGIYFVNVRSGDAVWTEQIVKQ